MKTIVTLTLAAAISLTAGFVSAADQPLTGNKRVLILSTTINPSTLGSWEAQAATGLGFGVDIASPAQWNAISAAGGTGVPPAGFLRFGQYWALILGDPTCSGGTAPVAAADATKAVWSPIVRNGNIIINGEDFSLHAPSQIGARIFITNAIRFATDCPTNTGLFASLSCYYSSAGGTGVGNTVTPVPVLSQVSLAGGFSVVEGNHNKAKVVAAHPALFGLNDAVLSNYGQSSHNLFRVWPSDFTVLAMMLDADAVNRIYPSMGTNGAPYIMAKGKGLVPIGDCCVNVTTKDLDCISTNMTYQWDVCITNCWTNDIKYFSFLELPAGVTISQQIVTLPSVLAPGKGACLTLFLTNTANLTNLCLLVGAHTTNFNICCSVTNCLTFPPCCVNLTREKLIPIFTFPPMGNCYNYSFMVKNVTYPPVPLSYLFLVPENPGCVSFTPNIIYFNPPLQPNQSMNKTVKVCLTPGCKAPFYFLAAAHNSNLVECCATRICLPKPQFCHPIVLAEPVDGAALAAGSTVPLRVTIDPTVVRPRRAAIYDGTNAIAIWDPIDGQHDDIFTLSANWSSNDVRVGVHTLTAQLTDTLDGVWDSEPATVFVVEHQHSDPAPAPLLLNPVLASGTTTFSIQTEPDVTYYVECATSPSSLSWTVLQTIVGDGSAMTVTDALTNLPQRFYRVRVDQ